MGGTGAANQDTEGRDQALGWREPGFPWGTEGPGAEQSKGLPGCLAAWGRERAGAGRRVDGGRETVMMLLRGSQVRGDRLDLGWQGGQGQRDRLGSAGEVEA